MTLVADIDHIEPPVVPEGAPVSLSPAAPGLWRVLERSGRVIGHIQARAADHDLRYRARRYHAGSRAFRDLGEFWSVADAIDCLRFAR